MPDFTAIDTKLTLPAYEINDVFPLEGLSNEKEVNGVKFAVELQGVVAVQAKAKVRPRLKLVMNGPYVKLIDTNWRFDGVLRAEPEFDATLSISADVTNKPDLEQKGHAELKAAAAKGKAGGWKAKIGAPKVVEGPTLGPVTTTFVLQAVYECGASAYGTAHVSGEGWVQLASDLHLRMEKAALGDAGKFTVDPVANVTFGKDFYVQVGGGLKA
ncbi:MAG: hypothetical protein FJ100_22690, partial [Deltaproteobacteria bacterium]|nr:hypothetical protein [Deltaproteobacteria bacterium]